MDKSGGQVDALDSAEYSGSLIMLLNEGVGFVKRNMKMQLNFIKNLPLTDLLVGIVVPIVAAWISYYLDERAIQKKKIIVCMSRLSC